MLDIARAEAENEVDEEVRATLLKDVQKQEASIGNKVLPKASSTGFLFVYLL